MSIISRIEQVLSGQPSRRPSPYSLSQSGKCVRMLAYMRHFPELMAPMTPRGLAIFELGHRIHDWVREKLTAAYGDNFHSIEKRVELEVTPELRVPGHIDGIVEDESGPVLLDIKSANNDSFARMVEYGPPYDYRAQVNAYLEATGLDQGVLLLYNKNTSDMRCLPVQRNDIIVEQVKRRFQAVAESAPDNLPEREHEKSSYACTYCPYRSRCW